MPMNNRLMRPMQNFTPRSIADLQLWLDASDASTLTLNGPTVSEWRSKAGTISVVQGTASAQPTLTQNYVGTRSALTFDGGDVLYAASSPLAIAPCTSFIVYDETTTINFAGLLCGTPATGDDFSQATSFITSARESGNVIMRASRVGQAANVELIANSGNQGAAAYGRKLVSIVVATSTASVRVNAVAGPTDTHAVSGSSSGTLVGGRFLSSTVSASFRFNGRICEILHYSRDLSTAEVQRVERWLAARWGITL